MTIISKIKRVHHGRKIFIFLLTTQFIFAGSQFQQNDTANDCCHSKVVKKSCCPMEEKTKCASERSILNKNVISRCGCIHNSKKGNDEFTSQNNYNYSKIVYLKVITINIPQQNIITFQNQFVDSKINSPPIYLADSSFII